MIALCAGITLLAALLFPRFAFAILILTAMVFLILLISPARRSVFPYLFEKRDEL